MNAINDEQVLKALKYIAEKTFPFNPNVSPYPGPIRKEIADYMEFDLEQWKSFYIICNPQPQHELLKLLSDHITLTPLGERMLSFAESANKIVSVKEFLSTIQS
jgi:hypothetical protein